MRLPDVRRCLVSWLTARIRCGTTLKVASTRDSSVSLEPHWIHILFHYESSWVLTYLLTTPSVYAIEVENAVRGSLVYLSNYLCTAAAVALRSVCDK